MSELIIYKGVDWTRTLTVTEKGTTTRKNLTGAAVRVVARLNPGDLGPAPIDLSVGSGVTLAAQSGATEGQATLAIAGAASALLEAGSYSVAVVVTPSGQPPQVAIPPTKLVVRELP